MDALFASFERRRAHSGLSRHVAIQGAEPRSCSAPWSSFSGRAKRLSSRGAGIWLSIAAVVVACGCSRVDSLSGTVPVSGTVTHDGRPLAQGTIRFAPESGGQPATGPIVDGRFKMQTTASSPGVRKGRYRVSIVSEKPGSIPDLPPGVPPGPNMPMAESLIPKRYNDVRSSGLEVDVTGPIRDLSFALEAN